MNTMPDLRIRPATDLDLPALARLHGQEHFFEDRLDRQRHGRGVLLIALANTEPVGSVYLWLDDAEEPEVRDRLPGVPLLTHLEVHPAHRNREIGSKLIGEAERYLFEHGHERVALGVSPHNTGAMRLYRRLGYAEWPYPPIATTSEAFLPDGARVQSDDTCRIFTKTLSKPPTDEPSR